MSESAEARIDARTALAVRERYLSARLEKIEQSRRRVEPLPQDFADQAAEQENDAVLDELALTTRAELDEVRVALTRLDASQYGRCIECGTPIGAGRLSAVPEAVTCIDCALSHA